MASVFIITLFLTIFGYTHATEEARCTYWKNKYLHIIANCSARNFTSFPEVRSDVFKLDLSHNKIEVLNDTTFLKFSNLHELNLSYNMLNYLQKGAFFGLQNLQKLDIQANYLLYDRLHFSKSVFKPLKSLTYLNIGLNNFPIINNYPLFSKYVLSDLKKVQHMVIDIGIAMSVFNTFQKGFRSLTELTTIESAYCFMFANKNGFLNVPHLKKIYLNCLIKSYAVGTLKGYHLDYLDLGKIVDISDKQDIMSNIVEDFKNMFVETLIFPMNSVFFQSPNWGDELFGALNHTGVKNLYLTNNDIQDFDFCSFGIKLPLTLENVDLSFCMLASFCFLAPNLVTVNLEHNYLANFLSSNTYCGLNSTNLTHINLSFNTIGSLDYSIFKGHHSLRSLNLSNNFLTDINFDLSHLTSLKILDISYNRIQKFSHNSLEKLNVMLDSSGTEINLSGNILECSCESIQFIEWILNKHAYFSQKNEIKCKFSNGQDIFLDDFENTLSQLKHECASYVGLIICLSIAISSFIVAVTIKIGSRYRWTLLHIYYMTTRKYNRNISKQIDDQNYKYDAYISFSEYEKSFIEAEFVNILEKESNFKLCINERDFIGGKGIYENIDDSFRDSRKIICIITKHFIDSDFCMQELKWANTATIDNEGAHRKLVLVFLERIRFKELPLLIRALVRDESNTWYIEYSSDEPNKTAFREKLKEAML